MQFLPSPYEKEMGAETSHKSFDALRSTAAMQDKTGLCALLMF
jgi:hypothetical protein